MKRFLLILFLILILPSFSACGRQEEPPVPPPVEEPEPSPPPTPPPPTEEELLAQRLDALLASMSLEEKVGQLFFVRCPERAAIEDVETYHLGGYLLFSRDFKHKSADEIRKTIAAYQSAAKIPLLIGVDEEGGTVVRISSNPQLRVSKFKSPQAVYRSGGMEGILEDAAEKDALLAGLGVNVNFAPVADVSTDPSDFIYDRSFGQDSETTAQYVAKVVSQMAGDNMGSVLKHFPGYGNNVDTHTGIALDSRPMETFEKADFLPFQAGTAAACGKAAVLVSHNIVECMDSEFPASLSSAVHQILREKLEFDGVVMTDDLAMKAVSSYAEDGMAALMALEAGNDMVVTTDYRVQIPKTVQAVENGTLDETVIDAACRRVLLWKIRLELIS